MKEEEMEKGDCGPPTRNVKRNTSCEPQVNGFYDQRPRWAGASEPRTSSQAGLFTVGHLSPSPIGKLDLVDDRGNAGEGASSAILFWGWSGGVSGKRVWLSSARWLVAAWFKSDKISKKKKKRLRVGCPQSPFSISSSFILFFVFLPFFFSIQNEYFLWGTG